MVKKDIDLDDDLENLEEQEDSKYSDVRRLRKKKLTPEQKQAIISRISMIIWSSKQSIKRNY